MIFSTTWLASSQRGPCTMATVSLFTISLRISCAFLYLTEALINVRRRTFLESNGRQLSHGIPHLGHTFEIVL